MQNASKHEQHKITPFFWDTMIRNGIKIKNLPNTFQCWSKSHKNIFNSMNLEYRLRALKKTYVHLQRQCESPRLNWPGDREGTGI